MRVTKFYFKIAQNNKGKERKKNLLFKIKRKKQKYFNLFSVARKEIRAQNVSLKRKYLNEKEILIVRFCFTSNKKKKKKRRIFSPQQMVGVQQGKLQSTRTLCESVCVWLSVFVCDHFCKLFLTINLKHFKSLYMVGGLFLRKPVSLSFISDTTTFITTLLLFAQTHTHTETA